MPSRTFIELVQEAYREAGIGGAAPTTVLNQVGRKADMVRFVQQAYERIQNMHEDWTFNWITATFDLTEDVDTYARGLRDVRKEGSYCYDNSVGITSRQWLTFWEWERFRHLVIPPAAGIPTHFTVKPDHVMQYFPVPDRANLKVVHEYHLYPQALAADTDEPRIPENYQDVIVWRAVMLFCDRVKDAQRYDTAKGEYDEYIDAMERKCRPGIMLGGALA